jgi:hypothetical protein
MVKGWDLIGNFIRLGLPDLSFNGGDNGPVKVRLGATSKFSQKKLAIVCVRGKALGPWIDASDANVLSFLLATVIHVIRTKARIILLRCHSSRY